MTFLLGKLLIHIIYEVPRFLRIHRKKVVMKRDDRVRPDFPGEMCRLPVIHIADDPALPSEVVPPVDRQQGDVRLQGADTLDQFRINQRIPGMEERHAV
ncbi:hypothetical protein D3C81_2055490 [compost metagenome]